MVELSGPVQVLQQKNLRIIISLHFTVSLLYLRPWVNLLMRSAHHVP